MQPGITVVIPTHRARTRNGMLNRAFTSAWQQTLQPAAVIVEQDIGGEGAWATRHRGLMKVTTEWTAFLDSDDHFYPGHLKTLHTAAVDRNADYVFSYYMVHDAAGNERPDVDPLGHFGKRFDPEAPHQTTITILVRTELAQQIGFREPPSDATIGGHRGGEDWWFTVECAQAGAGFWHVPTRSWAWVHHGLNSSGLPDRGDARH
jgi:hypothetical protein